MGCSTHPGEAPQPLTPPVAAEIVSPSARAEVAQCAPFRHAGLPVLICSLVLVLVLSRYVRRMEGRMQKSVMRRLAGVWVRDPSAEMHSTGGGDAVRAPRRPTRETLARPSAPPCAVMRRWMMSACLSI